MLVAGKGKPTERFRKRRPDLTGRMILQDLPSVVEGREAEEGVEYMAPDLFTPQPITGKGSESNHYHEFETAATIRGNHLLLPSCISSRPDSACKAILQHTITAMSTLSRTVIADMVLPDIGALLFGTLLDIGMMYLAVIERIERHWRELRSSLSLRIINIRHPTRDENESASVTETMLAEME